LTGVTQYGASARPRSCAVLIRPARFSLSRDDASERPVASASLAGYSAVAVPPARREGYVQGLSHERHPPALGAVLLLVRSVRHRYAFDASVTLSSPLARMQPPHWRSLLPRLCDETSLLSVVCFARLPCRSLYLQGTARTRGRSASTSTRTARRATSPRTSMALGTRLCVRCTSDVMRYRSLRHPCYESLHRLASYEQRTCMCVHVPLYPRSVQRRACSNMEP
jgi:hypothetical protein